MARVLLNHGLRNRRPSTQWLYRTAVALRRAGHQVSYPQFPNPDAPSIAEWQAMLVAELELLEAIGPEAGELIFIGHSLGGLNFIQAAVDGVLPVAFDRTLLVAPADPDLLPDLPVGGLKLDSAEVVSATKRLAGRLTLVGSDLDPWQPRGIQATFGDPFGVAATIIQGAKHFSDADGWGPWQGVIDWVTDPAADLAKR